MSRIAICALLLSLAVVGARAEPHEFPHGALPIDTWPTASVPVAADEQIVALGEVTGDGPATIVLRVDDGHSQGYGSRVNEERRFPPGPFQWTLTLAGAKTSGGRLLDALDARRLILFQAQGPGVARIDRFAVEASPRLPAGAVGLALGAPDAPAVAGLRRIGPGDPHILAGKPVAVRRPGLDPVVANGLAGVERLRIDFPPGRARVSLWTEDIGEWENLPRALRRRIRINGLDILDERLSPAQWIAQRYLAGRDREAGDGDDAWTDFGRHRGGLVSAEVDVGDQGVVVELAGDSATATYLSAVVIEPAGGAGARESVEAQRRAWMIGNYPVLKSAAPGSGLPNVSIGPPVGTIEPLKVALAPGTGARLSFAVSSPKTVAHPQIEIAPPALNGQSLGAEFYASLRRLDRQGAGSNLLSLDQRMLRADFASLPIAADAPRRYELWISAPEGAAPGFYEGSVVVASADGEARISIVAEVLGVSLPDAPAPAGFYLDEAPHLTWFDETRPLRSAQLVCDLATLRRFGVTGDAPALSTPDGEHGRAFLDDARLAFSGGLNAPWFAYAPLKRLLAGGGPEAAAERLAGVMSALAEAGLPAPIWSLADEPANAGSSAIGLAETGAILRAANPGLRLGAQFNNPADVRFATVVDVALINQGFGIDMASIARLRARGPDVWLYNTGRPRFTAGLWLWRTGASRYLQWHARMPSADPYDPTDGREGDVQIFPPMPQVCAAREDIHADLLDMAEGLVDQRWLAWLDRQAAPAARALAARLRRDIPDDWQSASDTGLARAQAARDAIIALARSLN